MKIDSEKNIITVKYNSEKTNLTEIEKAIALSGYNANNLKPTNEAYESLDYCCKKNSYLIWRLLIKLKFSYTKLTLNYKNLNPNSL